MAWTKWLAVLPFIGMLGGAAVFNQTTPIILGMPLLLAWLVFCVVMTSVVMGIVYCTDPARRTESDQ